MACTHTSHALHGCMTQLPSGRQLSVPVAVSQLQMVLSVAMQSKPLLQSVSLKQVPSGLKPAGLTPGGSSPSLTPSSMHLSCTVNRVCASLQDALSDKSLDKLAWVFVRRTAHYRPMLQCCVCAAMQCMSHSLRSGCLLLLLLLPYI